MHGEKNEMSRLKGKLVHETRRWSLPPTTSSPENGQPVLLRFRRDRRVACVGVAPAQSEKPARVRARAEGDDEDAEILLMEEERRARARCSGVLVCKDLKATLYADEELADSSPLSVTAIVQTLRMHFGAPADGPTAASCATPRSIDLRIVFGVWERGVDRVYLGKRGTMESVLKNLRRPSRVRWNSRSSPK